MICEYHVQFNEKVCPYSTDIGTLYLIFAGVSGVAGTILSLYIRFTLASPNSNFLDYNYHLYNGAPSNVIHDCWGCTSWHRRFHMIFICVINHRTYSIGIQTDLRTTACAKRLPERMVAKIQLTMVRLTNLKAMPGSKVPFMCGVILITLS